MATATKALPKTTQNALLAEYMREQLGADPDQVLGDLPSVIDILAQQDGLFTFEGPGYQPELGRYSQVFTDEDVRKLGRKHFVKVPDGKVTVRGLPGGTIMFRPQQFEDSYTLARMAKVEGLKPKAPYDPNVISGETESHTKVYAEREKRS